MASGDSGSEATGSIPHLGMNEIPEEETKTTATTATVSAPIILPSLTMDQLDQLQNSTNDNSTIGGEDGGIESKIENIMRIETKTHDYEITDSRQPSPSLVHQERAWRRGMVVTAYSPQRLEQLSEYALLVPPKIGKNCCRVFFFL
jgi:hypothetical protein